ASADAYLRAASVSAAPVSPPFRNSSGLSPLAGAPAMASRSCRSVLSVQLTDTPPVALVFACPESLLLPEQETRAVLHRARLSAAPIHLLLLMGWLNGHDPNLLQGLDLVFLHVGIAE